jgi:energy-coupling factor transport system permease protein
MSNVSTARARSAQAAGAAAGRFRLVMASLALLLAVTAAVVAVCGLPLRTALASVARMGWFFLLIFVMNALFFATDDAIWHWWILTLSVPGIVQGAQVTVRLLVMSNVLTCTTPPLEITGAIQTLLSPLRLVRLPVEDIAMILSVAVQFIPTLLEETDTIRKAQIARGARFESRRLHERAQAMLPLIVPIFLSAFKRADELAMAMEARGYRGARGRTRKKSVPLPLSGWGALALCALVCAAEILL